MALVRFEGEDGSFMWVETTPLGGSAEIGLVADEGDGRLGIGAGRSDRIHGYR